MLVFRGCAISEGTIHDPWLFCLGGLSLEMVDVKSQIYKIWQILAVWYNIGFLASTPKLLINRDVTVCEW